MTIHKQSWLEASKQCETLIFQTNYIISERNFLIMPLLKLFKIIKIESVVV